MNILTFDIEEWFHILNNPSTDNESSWGSFEYRLRLNIDRILYLLDKSNNIATFFCLGWVARKYPNIIKEILQAGHEIGTHSNAHQLIYRYDRSFFKNDLETSIKSLEDIIGKKIKAYRAPGFSLVSSTLWAFEELVDQGIEYDCSIFLGNHSHGGRIKAFGHNPSVIKIDGKIIKEFPVNSFRLITKEVAFSGGGYFRFLPYPIIKRLMNRSEYIMTYFHPRDFDYEQPIISDLSAFRKFKSYYGLKNSYSKAEKFVRDFDFVSLSHADKLIDWASADRFELVDEKLQLLGFKK
jgi:polysaccharide deacetylase family protein (PEP-CTERM system associated)